MLLDQDFPTIHLSSSQSLSPVFGSSSSSLCLQLRDETQDLYREVEQSLASLGQVRLWRQTRVTNLVNNAHDAIDQSDRTEEGY